MDGQSNDQRDEQLTDDEEKKERESRQSHSEDVSAHNVSLDISEVTVTNIIPYIQRHKVLAYLQLVVALAYVGIELLMFLLDPMFFQMPIKWGIGFWVGLSTSTAATFGILTIRQQQGKLARIFSDKKSWLIVCYFTAVCVILCTVGCIGGWVELVRVKDGEEKERRRKKHMLRFQHTLIPWSNHYGYVKAAIDISLCLCLAITSALLFKISLSNLESAAYPEQANQLDECRVLSSSYRRGNSIEEDEEEEEDTQVEEEEEEVDNERLYQSQETPSTTPTQDDGDVPLVETVTAQMAEERDETASPDPLVHSLKESPGHHEVRTDGGAAVTTEDVSSLTRARTATSQDSPELLTDKLEN